MGGTFGGHGVGSGPDAQGRVGSPPEAPILICALTGRAVCGLSRPTKLPPIPRPNKSRGINPSVTGIDQGADLAYAGEGTSGREPRETGALSLFLTTSRLDEVSPRGRHDRATARSDYLLLPVTNAAPFSSGEAAPSDAPPPLPVWGRIHSRQRMIPKSRGKWWAT
jgi:hypothetical protein